MSCNILILRLPSLISIPIALFLIVSAFGPAVASSSSSYSSQTAASSTGSCLPAVASDYARIVKSDAIANATASRGYSNASARFSALSYNSIFQIGTVLGPQCDDSISSITVVFTIFNSSGFYGFLYVTENPLTLAVVGSIIRTNLPSFTASCAASSGDSCSWAGYQVYANSGHTAEVTVASVDFEQPAPSYPSTGCNTVFSYQECVLSNWAGLEDTNGASDGHLAQAGTAGECIYSNSQCSVNYSAWYETIIPNSSSNSAVVCTASNGGQVNIHGGDQMSTYTYNEVTEGGSDTSYDFDIADSTSGSYCYAGGVSYSYLTNPTIADFIFENQEQCQASTGECASLAEFSSSTFTAADLYNLSTSTTYGIYQFTSKGWDYSPSMWNAPYNTGRLRCGTAVENVATGSVGSSSSFTETWKSSAYTPVYNGNNC
jgi:hypothetical protein